MAARKTTRKRTTARRATSSTRRQTRSRTQRSRTTARRTSRTSNARRARQTRTRTTRSRATARPRKATHSSGTTLNTQGAPSTRKVWGVIGLIVNILLFPGLGTIIGGRAKDGVWQIILLAVGIILSALSGIGLVVVLAAWIWALVSSIQILQRKR